MNTSQMVVAIRNGSSFESRVMASPAEKWQHCSVEDALGDWSLDKTKVRTNPELIPIDMSVLVSSGIDCQFGTGKEWISYVRGPLQSIHPNDSKPYSAGSVFYPAQFLRCQPRIAYMHSWQGGDCPLPPGFIVQIYTRGEGDEEGEATEFEWDWSISDNDSVLAGDIISFKVLGLAPGYCWPWDVK